jgi:hypothetical protein
MAHEVTVDSGDHVLDEVLDLGTVKSTIGDRSVEDGTRWGTDVARAG